MKFKGFTMPELFCTLLLIAVLAILFWQMVYLNYIKCVTSSKIKKFNSLIKQAQIKAQTYSTDWADYYFDPNKFSAQTFLDLYILPYISYMNKDKDLDGNVRVILSDGSSFSLEKNNCMTFIYDINNDKHPNEAGKDTFYFNYCPFNDNIFTRKGEVIPYLKKDVNTKEKALELCKTEPKYCTGFLFFDDYSIGSDYPHKLYL